MMRFNTQRLEDSPLASYDIKVTNEDKTYQMALFNSSSDTIDEFNFMIEEIIPGILQRKFQGKDNTIIDVKGVEIRFPYFSAEDGNFLMTPFIARTTGSSYMCDVYINYKEIKETQQQLYNNSSQNTITTGFVESKIETRKIGSFHCMVGSNRDITSVKPKEFKLLDEWKMLLGECPGSPGAYIINKGGEKSYVYSEKLRTNTYITFKTKGDVPLIESRITCLNDSITTLIRLQIGKRRPTVKVILPHLKGKHYPLYLTFYLLFYSYNNTNVKKTEFPINLFENLIANFTTPENRDKILQYLRPSKEKFIERFIKLNKSGFYYIDEEEIRSYINAKLGNQRSKNAEEDSKRFIMATISQSIPKELFIQCSEYNNKVANLAWMTCKTILCATGFRDFDSRDKWGVKKADSLVRAISQYVATDLVEHIKNGSTDTNGFNFGKSDKKDSIIETRKCETINAAIAVRDKISNQVDARTNSISLREVSESQFPNICPAKTPEGETCGLNKVRAALSHISYNQEYSLNRKLAIDDLLKPFIYYFSFTRNNEFKYKVVTIDFYGRFMYFNHGTTQNNISPDGLFFSTRILTIFNDAFKKERAVYYIDDDTIYIRFDQSLELKAYKFESYVNGVIHCAVPDEFADRILDSCKASKNPDYNQYSSIQKNDECYINIGFKLGDNGVNQTVTIIQESNVFGYLFVSLKFIDYLKTIISKKDKIELFKTPDGIHTCIVTCKSNLSKYDYIHWSGFQIACMLPAYIQKAFGMMLGVINDYYSTEKSKKYDYFFTFNGTVQTDPTSQEYFPKVLWCNGAKLTSYLKGKRRSGYLPFDSCVHIDEVDHCVQYFDDSGRPMAPLLVVDDNGQLVIDKLNSWANFEDRDFDKAKEKIEGLYKDGSLELVDSKEMDPTLIALDLRECRTIYDLKRFLNSLDLKSIKSSIFYNESNGYYRVEDISSIKVHGNIYEIEFTKQIPSFKTLEFIQDGETYYGTYVFNKKIYEPIKKQVFKLERPTNGRIKDTFYMVYHEINDQGKLEMKFITTDDDFITDGDNIYKERSNPTYREEDEEDEEEDPMSGFEKYKIHYVEFQEDSNHLYVDSEMAIQKVFEFSRDDLSNNVLYLHKDKVIRKEELVDNHFILIDGKYHVVDEVHFNNGELTGLFKSKNAKIHEYIPESNKDYLFFNLEEENKKELDEREAKLYLSMVRRHMEEIQVIPKNYFDEQRDLEYQFHILTLLKEQIAIFGNKKTINVLRRYLTNGFKFTHCLIDPSAAYSVIANFVPKADSNPGPRFAYQCAMGTQAMGVNNCVWYRRYETSNKRLISPMEHLFETVAELPLNQVTMPITQNFVILVSANYKGFEDPIIVSEAALKKFGRYEREIVINETETSTTDYIENIAFPKDKMGNPKTDSIYRHLDKDGLPRIGSVIKKGDCILGKQKTFILPEGPKVVNSSYYAGVKDGGVVTSVVVVGSEGTSSSFRNVIIKIVQRRYQQVGDKMASRYSQKGTIGDIIGGMINNGDPRLRIVDDCLMPFVVGGPNHGMRAELIFNPASFPSRMTAGLIKEILCTKAALYLQQKVDASNFHYLNEEYYRDALWENKITDKHMDINGSEFMCHSDGEIIMDSTTGKPMKFYIGVVAYQFLRHHVADKETARATGPVKAITHQPNEGIKFQGAQRMGEMERDALISSGAAGTLFDRFMLSSDEYIDVFCNECKNNSSMSSLKSKVCQICGTAGSLVSVSEPRIYKVFMHMMNAVGLEIKETLKPIDEYQNEIFKINKTEAELSAKDIL